MLENKKYRTRSLSGTKSQHTQALLITGQTNAEALASAPQPTENYLKKM